jgi:tetratricopeptide (TPR) repeat protein
MGPIALTHQNLLIQPQISQGLIKEDKISEQQILESEEYFESGKVFLTDKKYKDASKMFTKSLAANKTNYDALFYRAVTNLDQDLPEKAIKDLEELMKICTDYRKTMFIVLSIAYRRVNDYISAIRALSKAIQKYPQYLEAYIARGQIYIFQKKWDKALADFKTVLKCSAKNGMGYLG